MKSIILIIEDDDMINNMIKEAMENEGYSCIQAFSGTEGILLTKTENVDLVILDLMLPGKNGEEVIKEIKALKNIPVIIVSAKDGIDSKVELLRSGADDYLTKPFDIRELGARVEVSLRKYNIFGQERSIAAKGEAVETDTDPGINEHLIIFHELQLNPDNYTTAVKGNELDLTKHEFRILELLLKNPNRAFSKQQIYDFAWDDAYLGEDNTVNVHVSNLRKKIKKYTDTEYIETVWGIGFKLRKENRI